MVNGKLDACNPCVQLFCRGGSPHASKQQQQHAAAAHRLRIVAPADRSIASAVVTAEAGTTRLLAEAQSCLGSSFTGAEADAIGSEILRRPRGRATQTHVKARMCAFIFFPRTPQTTAKKYNYIYILA